MLRFVILHHTGYGDEHWDLMLEKQGTLLTWKLPNDPGGGAKLPIKAIRIGDHRPIYLDYEGPVSGNRGTVIRKDSGSLNWITALPDKFLFGLDGIRLKGTFRLTQVATAWFFDRVDTSNEFAAEDPNPRK